MTGLAVRLLTLATFVTASVTAPMIAAANATTEGGTVVKKKHKRTAPAARRTQTPTSSQYPPNMSEAPARKAGGY